MVINFRGDLASYLTFQEGEQIICIPPHADHYSHKDCERGFVTKDNGNTVFCRFFRKNTQMTLVNHDPELDVEENEAQNAYYCGWIYGALRTKSNSESVKKENIIRASSSTLRFNFKPKLLMKALTFMEEP